jgi:hypothetical protein
MKLALLLIMAGAIGRGQTPPDKDPEIVTDRPDVTESAIVVPKGSVQFENGMTWSTARGNRSLGLSETLMRIGFSTKTEARVVLPNYVGGLGRNSVSGFDDFGLGIKQQIGPFRGDFDLSVIAGVSLPTGADRISSHGCDPFVKVPWSKELKDGWSIGGMESVFWYTQEGRRNGTWESTFYLERQISKPLDVFAEYAGDFAQRGGPQEIAHFGAAYKLAPLHLVDFHFGFGLSQAAPDRFFAVGYSFRIDALRSR